MDELAYYRQHSPCTDPGPYRAACAGLPSGVAELSEVVRGLIAHRDETSRVFGFDLPPERRDEANSRYVTAILDHTGGVAPREPQDRFAGTCRDFTMLLCSFLREKGVPARGRAGFGGYFTPGFFADHWVAEYWTEGVGWRLADAELAGAGRAAYPVDFDRTDVPRDAFLVGGKAWRDCRAGRRDADTFGVAGTDLTGMWEIQGNVLRDLAALNLVETLPWDNWGLIERHFTELTQSELALLDRAAVVSADGGPVEQAREVFKQPAVRRP